MTIEREMITWKHKIISIRLEYLQPNNPVQIIFIRNTFYHIAVCKKSLEMTAQKM